MEEEPIKITLPSGEEIEIKKSGIHSYPGLVYAPYIPLTMESFEDFETSEFKPGNEKDKDYIREEGCILFKQPKEIMGNKIIIIDLFDNSCVENSEIGWDVDVFKTDHDWNILEEEGTFMTRKTKKIYKKLYKGERHHWSINKLSIGIVKMLKFIYP